MSCILPFVDAPASCPLLSRIRCGYGCSYLECTLYPLQKKKYAHEKRLQVPWHFDSFLSRTQHLVLVPRIFVERGWLLGRLFERLLQGMGKDTVACLHKACQETSHLCPNLQLLTIKENL
jgi:hypothetical protein